MSFTNVTNSPWRDSTGKFLTESLFLEFKNPYWEGEPMWTIRDEEFKGIPSAKKVYLDARDPTEYIPALIICENWAHWLRLLENKRIFAEIEKWRMELEVKIRSEAIQGLRLSDKGSDLKWLAERGWADRKVGRPSKEKKARDAGINKEIEEDLKRIGLLQ